MLCWKSLSETNDRHEPAARGASGAIALIGARIVALAR